MKTIKRTFTLIELLTVIAIIALIAGITMPAIGKARAKARTTQCTGQIKQLGALMFSYAGDYRWKLPQNQSSTQTWGYGNDKNTFYIDYLGEDYNLKLCPSWDGTQTEDYKKESAMAYGMNTNADWKDTIHMWEAPAFAIMMMDYGYSGWAAWTYSGKKLSSAGFADHDSNKKANADNAVPWYRHQNSGNICFGDGHVENVQRRVFQKRISDGGTYSDKRGE